MGRAAPRGGILDRDRPRSGSRKHRPSSHVLQGDRCFLRQPRRLLVRSDDKPSVDLHHHAVCRLSVLRRLLLRERSRPSSNRSAPMANDVFVPRGRNGSRSGDVVDRRDGTRGRGSAGRCRDGRGNGNGSGGGCDRDGRDAIDVEASVCWPSFGDNGRRWSRRGV
jgi:hypothetical protein